MPALSLPLLLINIVIKIINKALIFIFINFDIIKMFYAFSAIFHYANKIHEVI